MKKKLEKVIRKIILPTHPDIEDVKIYDDNKIDIWDRNMKKIIVRYWVDKTFRKENEVETETRTLYQMLSPDSKESIDVYFHVITGRMSI